MNLIKVISSSLVIVVMAFGLSACEVGVAVVSYVKSKIFLSDSKTCSKQIAGFAPYGAEIGLRARFEAEFTAGKMQRSHQMFIRVAW